MSKMKPDGTYPYRPPNGISGEFFMEKFCYRCKRDAPYQDSGNSEDGCEIIIRTMIFDVGNDEYPTEWISDDDCGLVNPRCTAFEPMEEKK